MPNSRELFKNLTIQTLTNLSLSSYMQSKLRTKVLAYIKEDQCSKSVSILEEIFNNYVVSVHLLIFIIFEVKNY